MSCMPTLYNTGAVAQVKSISVSNPRTKLHYRDQEEEAEGDDTGFTG